MILLKNYYSPFLCAFTILILLGIAEVISLVLGLYLSGGLDAHIDHINVSTHESPAIQFLDYLNVGRIPIMVVICLILGCFGLIGICSQYCIVSFFGFPLSPILVSIFSLILTFPLVHALGKSLAPWLPHDESGAVSEESFIGCLALITGAVAIAGKPCEASLRFLVEDKFVNALRATAAQMTMHELQDTRENFVQGVQNTVAEDLSKNGGVKKCVAD